MVGTKRTTIDAQLLGVMIGFMNMRFTCVFLSFSFFLSFFGYMHDTHGLLMVTTQLTQYLMFDSWSRTDHRP